MSVSTRAIVAAFAVALVSGCSQEPAGAATDAAADSGTDAATDAAAGADGAPQAKGGGDPALQETPLPKAPVGATAIAVETLAEGLVNPWCVAFLPDGTILVTERAGRLRIIRDGQLQEAPVGGVPEVFVAGQAGLFDILPHPDFAANGTVFLSYAHGTEQENATRVARATFDGQALSNLEVIYEAKPIKDGAAHYGAKIVYAPDGTLFVSIGEGSKYKERAQVMSSSFGAIIHINQDGSIPDGNPSFGEGSLPELWSKGQRNPQGLAWDSARGILWETEHGPKGGDELNIIEKGANYGWPIATYGIDYNGAKISPFTEYEGTTQPVKYWLPSIGPSGLAVYEGDLFAAWRGDLLLGALSETEGKALHRIDLDDAGNIVGEERYLVDVAERIRDVRVGPDGAIYVTTEERRGEPVGKVLRLTPQ